MKRWILLSLMLVFAANANATRKPNLLILSIDTLRADHLSCYGYERPTSPSIDLIAANGTRFALAHSTAPWTLPSFASMLTGRMPTRHGAIATGDVKDISQNVPSPLSPEVSTLGEVMRDAGYTTGAVTSNPYLRLGPLRGFENPICKAVRADRIGALARDWLAREVAADPWFLWVHFNDPHEPTLAADPQLRAIGAMDDVDASVRNELERWGSERNGTHLGFVSDASKSARLLRTKLALYDAEIRRVDNEIGRILEFLQRRQWLANTLVVIVSDHGEEFHEHAAMERSWGLDPRGMYGIGHGHSLFQEQLHVPWIMMGPRVRPGRTVEQTISLVDMMPTLLGLIGLNPPAGMDGVDRQSWIEDSDREDLPVLAESLAYGPDRMCRIEGGLKLIADRTGGVQALFDLEADGREQIDLSPVADSLAVDLLPLLLDWNDEAVATAPASMGAGELTDEMREGLKSLGYVQ